MAYSSRPVVEHVPPRSVARVRCASSSGCTSRRPSMTKLGLVLVGGVLPLPGASERWISTMPTIVTKQASDNPILFYKHFLENTVLTHPELFAHLTALGETITGIGLTLGLFTGRRVAGGADPGDELRPGDAVDVTRAAGISHRAVRP